MDRRGTRIIGGGDEAHPQPARTVPEALAHWAAVASDAEALVWSTGGVTYGGLDTHRRRMAAELRELAVEQTDRVLVALEGPSGALALVGLVGSAVVVPVDPTLSEAELERCLVRVRPRALFVGEREAERVEPVARRLGARVVVVRDDPAAAAGAAPGTAAPQPRPEQLGALVRTSGTTSEPKIVCLSHYALLHGARQVADTLRLGRRDRCLHVMPLFHTHGLLGALFSSLVTGGSVVCTAGFRGYETLELAARLGATWYTAVPVVHHSMVSAARTAPEGRALPRLRAIRSNAAPLPRKLHDELRTVFGAPVVQAYAMTEMPGQIASNPLAAEAQRPDTVGLPTGCELAVLTDRGDVRATDAAGEVVIRGPHLMSGYLDEPERTAARFAGTWFRTGDLGRLDGDGYLTLGGRVDDVVNKGGEKISPAEVEAAALEHPAVADAACFAVDHPTLGQDVALAVVARQDGVEDTLADFLRARLAPVKVPRRTHVVDEIPRSRTGKILRRVLAERLGGDYERRPAETGPGERHPTSVDAVCSVVARVLDQPHVGADDDFFLVGGDSLSAATVANALQRELGVAVGVRDVFEGRTPRALAARLGAGGSPPASAPEPAGERRPNVLPLSAAQEMRLVRDARARALGDEPNPFQLVRAFRVEGPLDDSVLADAIRTVIARHDALRTSFDGNTATSRLHEDVEFDLERRTAEDERAAIALLQSEAVRPLERERPPRVRVTVVQIASGVRFLLVVVDHLVGDRRSLQVLFREVSECYGALAEGRAPLLGERPLQLSDVIRGERTWLGTEAARAIADATAPKLAKLTLLPFDPAGGLWPPPQARLSDEAYDLLKQGCGERGATVLMGVTGAIETWLSEQLGCEELTVRVPALGRPTPETESVVGWLANQVLLHVDLAGSPSAAELLLRVRKAALAAWDDQAYPFAELLRRFRPEEWANPAPSRSLYLDLASSKEFDDQLRLGDLRLRRVELESDTWASSVVLRVVDDGSSVRLTVLEADRHDAFFMFELAECFEEICAAFAHELVTPRRIATTVREGD